MIHFILLAFEFVPLVIGSVKKPNYWKYDDAIYELNCKGKDNLKVSRLLRLEEKAEQDERERLKHHVGIIR